MDSPSRNKNGLEGIEMGMAAKKVIPRIMGITQEAIGSTKDRILQNGRK